MPDGKEQQTTPNTGTPENERATGNNTPQGEKPETKSIPYDRFKQVIEERNQLKAMLEQIKKQQEEAEKKKLAEQEKWKDLYEKTQAELQAKENEVKEQKLFNETLVAAKELDIVDPEAAWALIRGKIDEQHTVQDLLKDLVKKKPWLKKAAAAGYTLPGAGTPPTTPDADAISKMTMEQYRAFREKQKKNK